MLILKVQILVNKHTCFHLKIEPLICLPLLCCLIDHLSGWFDLIVFLACDLSSSWFLFLKCLEHIRNQFAILCSDCRPLLKYLVIFNTLWALEKCISLFSVFSKYCIYLVTFHILVRNLQFLLAGDLQVL